MMMGQCQECEAEGVKSDAVVNAGSGNTRLCLKHYEDWLKGVKKHLDALSEVFDDGA